MMTKDAKTLIREAFDMAKSSGKPDWHRMTTAVLKNRLLMLTQGKFQESDYGVNNIVEFVQQDPELTKLDRSQSPPIVELHANEASPTPLERQTPLTYERIRPDLWRAVIDYSSGNKYVWDTTKGIARPQTGEDFDQLILPTITPEEEEKWRRDFADKFGGSLTVVVKNRLTAWVERGISPKFLPHDLLGKWNDYVKTQILELLTRWFNEHKVAPPERLVVAVRRPTRITGEEDLEELRNVVIGCVKVMTQEELVELRLPPLSVLRARKS